MDAYVFIRGADATSLAALRTLEDGRLRVVSDLIGPEDAFTAIEAKDLGDLQRTVMDSIRGTGLRDSDTSIAVRVPDLYEATEEATQADSGSHRPTALRRWLPVRRVEAYVRVRTERGRAGTVYDTVHELDGYLGHALVAGRSDLIVGMGGNDFATVAADVLELNRMDGVRSTETSFAFNE